LGAKLTSSLKTEWSSFHQLWCILCVASSGRAIFQSEVAFPVIDTAKNILAKLKYSIYFHILVESRFAAELSFA